MTAAAAHVFEEGVQLHRTQQLAAAEKCYRMVLQQQPCHADSLHQLGALLVQQHGAKQYKEALRLVQAAIQQAPSNARYRHSLGVVHEAAEQWASAADAFERAVDKCPDDVKYRMHAASALKAAGQLGRSAGMYKSVLQRQPQHPTAHYKLGSVLRQLGRLEAAAEAYRQHLQKDPKHVQAAFWLSAVSQGAQPSACPPEIVSKLFDGYSDHFDDHLVNKLGYKTPGVLMECLLHHANAVGSNSKATPQQQQQQRRWSRCVDLGCGTGLMGPLLQPHTQQLCGVDVSQGMVQKAQERRCYDQLAVDELVHYLAEAAAAVQQKGAEPFDLFVAADVFVYLGDLKPVLQAAAAAAAERAVFAFSTELLEAGSSSDAAQSTRALPYVLQLTGRYAHTQAYLQEVAAACGWQVVLLQEADIRQNAGKPIRGSQCLLRRGCSSTL